MKIKNLLLAALNSRPESQNFYCWVQLNKNELNAFVSVTGGIKRATCPSFERKGQFSESDKTIKKNNTVIHTRAHTLTQTYTEYKEVRQRKISIDLNVVM